MAKLTMAKLTVGDLKKYIEDFGDSTPVYIESAGEIEMASGVEDHEDEGNTSVLIVGEI